MREQRDAVRSLQAAIIGWKADVIFRDLRGRVSADAATRGKVEAWLTAGLTMKAVRTKLLFVPRPFRPPDQPWWRDRALRARNLWSGVLGLLGVRD